MTLEGLPFNPKSWQVYDQIDADVYCFFGVTALAAEVVAFGKLFGKTSVLISASDIDFSERYTLQSTDRNPWGMEGRIGHFVIHHADFIVVQNVSQGEVLKQRFGRTAPVIRNPIPIKSAESIGPRQSQRCVLWIGKSNDVKRPELCYELARRCPELPFLMIMNPGCRWIHKSVTSKRPSNVRIIEQVPFSESDELFRNAAVLVNTSRFEGFPYTFLQCGVHGVPILSLEVNPDGFLTGLYDCGIVAGGDMDKMADSLRLLYNSHEVACGYADRLNAYVRHYHEASGRVEELIECLQSISQERDQPNDSGRRQGL